MARAIWKGVIRLGDLAVPVKLYSAVQDRGVGFRLLSRESLRPVRQRMIHPDTGDEVPADQVRSGFAVEDDVFVILDDDELEAVQPEPSRDIRIGRFVDPDLIDHRWYDRPYHLGPDADDEAYAALVEALRRQHREGVARWTMRNQEYVGALREQDGHLVLITLRHADEVLPIETLEPPAGREPDRRELDMARQLVTALEDDFDPDDYRDEYRDRVLELVHAKAEGKTIELRPPERREPAGDLAASLEASLRAAREERKSA